MRRAAITLVVAATVSSAQERPTPPDRRALVPPRDSIVKVLPTIDLPEYVITGLSSIDLPHFEKRFDDAGPVGGVLVGPAPAFRDPATGPAPGSGLKGGPSIASAAGIQAHVRAGMGSYRMPQLEASVRSSIDAITLGAQGHYRRSSGFAPETGWSEGGAGASATLPINLVSSGVSNSSLSGDLGFESRSYHWYGTSSPSDRRTLSMVDGGLAARGWLSGWNGAISLRFGSVSVDDTSSSVSEATTRVAAGVNGEIGGVPLIASMEVRSSSRSVSSVASSGLSSLKVESRWQSLPSVLVSGGLGIAYLQGDGGQSRVAVFPSVRVQLAIDDRHRLAGAFEPRALGITLMSSQSVHRFLDARTHIRQTAWTNSGRFGLESDWTSEVRTRVELEAGKGRDLAMIADTSGRGVAQWMYSDASYAALRAECVAKMRGNDYFSATIILRSSRNEASGLSIPYWPRGEARVSYLTEVMRGLKLLGSVQVVGARESQWAVPASSLPGYATVDVSGRYAVTSSLAVWLEATNLSNAVYQHWKGIQEPPFRLSAGIALAW
jgi:hypothetical protein